MEVYQWRLNTPGNYQGIVLASDDAEAFESVKSYANYELNSNTNDIDLLWIGYNNATNPEVYILNNM